MTDTTARPGAPRGLEESRRRAAGLLGKVSAAQFIVYAIAALVAVFLVWAAFAPIDEITRAEGRVIPTSKTQVIQSSEPGVVEAILARVGQRVNKGDVLMRLDSTPTETSLGEVSARRRALTAQAARLRIENSGDLTTRYVCPDEIEAVAPQVCSNEANLMAARFGNLKQTVAVLESREKQRRLELAETRANMERITNNLALARKEHELLEPLAKKQIVPQTDFLRAQRDVSELEGQLASTTESIARIEAALEEARLQVEEATLRFRQDALAELTKVLAELSVTQQTARGAQDRVARTEIRSPVDGIVNSLAVNTLGAFVNAGGHVADVVPVDDNLLVEAKVKPADIAFIRPGQEATVKITSYDFSIYGGLGGIVEHVSADSIYDEEARETFYIVYIKSENAYLERDGKTYPIIPGMTSQVDILTGKKTILDYLLKPINKARQEALRER